MAERTPNGGSGADILDRVRWDYDPEGEQLSPLVSTERYFRDFPWEPAELMEPEPPPTPRSGTES
jgi:hypothetical protein